MNKTDHFHLAAPLAEGTEQSATIGVKEVPFMRECETTGKLCTEDCRTEPCAASVPACLCGQPISEACKAHGCRYDKEKVMVERLGFDLVLHMLRNPHGFKEAELCRARLEAADRLEGLQDAYLNMRQWAEQNGLDTVARGNAGCTPGVQGTEGQQ